MTPRTVARPTPVTTRVPELILPTARTWIARLDPGLRQVCGYQLGLCDADGRPRASLGGKLVRPTLSMLCAVAAGGDPADVVPCAVAVEAIHNATLIHDDIMDGDEERRHRPTAWVEFGVPRAILAGDALIALSFEILADDAAHPAAPGALARLAETLRILARGQDHDLCFESDDDVTLERCCRMIADKTGALLSYACEAGARYAGVPSFWIDRFRRFGEDLGMTFQIADDVLGIWGDPDVTGKPVGADLRIRKKSTPVVAALRAESPAAAELAALYARPPDLDDDETIARAAQLVVDAGGRAWADAAVRRHHERAWSWVRSLDLEPTGAAELEALSRGLIERDR